MKPFLLLFQLRRRGAEGFDGESVAVHASTPDREIEILRDAVEARQQPEIKPLLELAFLIFAALFWVALLIGFVARIALRAKLRAKHLRQIARFLLQSFERGAHRFGLVLVAKKTGAHSTNLLRGIIQSRRVPEGAWAVAPQILFKRRYIR